MKKISAIGLCLALGLSTGTQGQGSVKFSKIHGIEDVRIKKVAVSRKNPSFMAVASENSLFASNDGGKNFRKVVVLKSEQTSHLFIDEDLPSTLYLAGTRQCYKVGGKTTERIFSADEGEVIYFIAKHKSHIYIATSDGLYYAEKSLPNWKTVPGLKGNSVYSVKGTGNNISVASDTGVYFFNPTDNTLRRTFVSGGIDEGSPKPRQIEADSLTPKRLWLGTSKGVFSSSDQGETWKKFFISGADNVSINCLGQHPLEGTGFYICTDSGFFKINIADGKATPLFEGLPTSRIKWMDFDAAGEIYLATDQGLFTSKNSTTSPPSRISLQEIMKGEPCIREVQEAALHYNAVHPKKVSKWHKRLKYRALLPRFSVDYDKTIGSSFTSGGYYYAEGPYDWGMSLTWDLDELIWSPYETTIDNRTKLTTQQRIDILDGVNRLYFERLRLKREIATSDPYIEETIQKELRLLELTATLDGYTGGFLTQSREASNL
ncbi:MAG: hypothetical protein ABFR47_05585 [Verrucomicrobiota bacterium]